MDIFLEISTSRKIFKNDVERGDLIVDMSLFVFFWLHGPFCLCNSKVELLMWVFPSSSFFFFLLFFLAWSVLFVHALFFVFYLLSPSQAYEAAGLPLFMVCFVCNKEQFYMWVLEIRFSLCLLERMFQTAAQKMKNHYNLLFHLVYLRNALSEAWNRNAIVESRSM